jgi:hypothetical protein
MIITYKIHKKSKKLINATPKEYPRKSRPVTVMKSQGTVTRYAYAKGIPSSSNTRQLVM